METGMMVGSKIGKLATDVALIVLSAALIGGSKTLLL
jgi:hypothetical protein